MSDSMSAAEQPRDILKQTTRGELCSLHVGCPSCGQTYIFPFAEEGELPESHHCAACSTDIPFTERRVKPGEEVEVCPVCSCKEFYLQKDFNRRLGFFVVVISGLIAFLLMLQHHLLGFIVLLAVTGLDVLIYYCLRTVSICYKCQTIFRSFPRSPEHVGFSLETEEKYKRIRQDWIREMTE